MTTGITAEQRAQLGVLDVDMAAALLECSPATVKDEVAAGRIPHVRLGRSPVFPIGALLEYLNKRALGAPAPTPSAIVVPDTPEPAKKRRAPPRLPGLSS